MSELIAEARVLVTPDTTAFRAQLTAQLAAATKGIVVPIPVTAVSAGGTAAADALAAGATRANKSVKEVAGATDALSKAEKEAAKDAAEHARQLANLARGAGATALSFAGLRGATLAASAPFIAGAAAAVAFAKAIGIATQFQTELKVLQATSGATAEQLVSVGEAARQLGADVTLPGVSAVDAAQAMTELSKAGLSVQESIDGARGVLQLATAAGIDNATATELAASALNAFGLAGNEAVHVADVLANSANDAQGSITDIGIALQQASAAGRQAGLSLEQTVGILTEFARAGIKGSDAGTLLRTLLIRLINPTNKANEVMQKLGLHIRDATGNINLAFFDEFARKTANLTKAERDRDAAIIAGQDAFRGLTILARNGGAALDAQVDSLNKAGTAAEIAGARTSGLAGAAENLQNQLTNAGLAIGTSLIPGLTSIIDVGADAVATTSDLVGEISKLREEATKPIELTLDLSGGGGGGDGGGFLDRPKKFIDDFVSTLPGQIAGAAENFSHLQQIIRESNAEFEAVRARRALPGIIEDLNKAKANPVAFNETILRLRDLEKQMVGGNAETETFRKSFAAFISFLQDASAQPITLPIKLPDEVLRGTFGEKEADASGKNSAEAFGKSFIPSVGDAFKIGAEQGWQAFKDAAATNAKDAALAVAAAVRGAISGVAQGTNQQAGLDDVMNQILLGGGSPSQQIAAFQRQFAVQQNIIDRATAGLKGLTSGDKGFATLTAAVRAARDKQVQINGQIESIQNQVVADQKSRAAAAKQQATEAQRARDEADQAVIDQFAPAQSRLNIQEITANATARLSDNVRLQNAIIAEANREVAIIKNTVKNVQTRNAALRAQAAIIKTAETERSSLLAQIAQTATENRQKAANAVQTFLANQITLAELRENDSAEVAAINKAIANARKRIANYKKLGLNLQEEKIALEELINKRDEVLNTAKDGTTDGGTTLADLFKSTQDIFAQSGNVGRLPSQLTTSSANAPIRDLVNQRLELQLSANPLVTSQNTATAATDRLTASINDLISRLGGGVQHGGIPSPAAAAALTKAVSGENRFTYQRVANSIVEAGVWG